MVQCNLQPVAWMPSRSRSLPFPAGINNCTSHVCSPLRTQTGSQRPMPVRWQSRPSFTTGYTRPPVFPNVSWF